MSGNSQVIVATNRACDRCRRRKAKCDLIDSVCSRCKAAGLKCTFDLPVQRRGPKTRYPAKSAAGDAVAIAAAGRISTFALQKPPASTTIFPDTAATSTIPLPETTWEEVRIPPDATVLSSKAEDFQDSLLDEALTQPSPAFQRWNDLETQIKTSVPDVTLEGMVVRCFDLYFEYLFPLTPLVDESSLREILDSFLTGNMPLRRHDSTNSSGICHDLGLPPEPAFALITAVCAETAFLLPAELFPEGNLVSDAFLKASRSSLESYVEEDLENTNAASVIIRYYHYNCFHEAGRSNFARYVFGEATSLAQAMQMNDELSYQSLHQLEAELRRRAFWVIFMEDKSVSILSKHPITIHTVSFDTGITVLSPIGDITEAVLDMPSIISSPEPDFVAGFNANIKLWQIASDILLEIRMLQEHSRITQSALSPLSSEGSNTLDMLYVRFITCLDNLPRYLRMDKFDEHDVVDYQDPNDKMATIQKVNLHITIQFLRMALLQKISALEPEPMSKSEARMLVFRKTEVARDMLRVLRCAPFWALQINRLYCAEKIHFVSAGLLTVFGDEENESSSLTRARSDFAIFIEMLTKLNYRVPETLK